MAQVQSEDSLILGHNRMSILNRISMYYNLFNRHKIFIKINKAGMRNKMINNKNNQKLEGNHINKIQVKAKVHKQKSYK